MSSIENTTWPERFVYVCGAGGAATVNISPLLHSGRNRVQGVVIMSAVSNERQPTPTDFSQSIKPTKRLKEFCTQVLNLDGSLIKVITKNSDSLRDWQDVLDEASNLAEELDAEIVFNVTGGRKPATLGALLGYRPLNPQSPRLSLISIGHAPFQARLIRITKDGDIQENLLPIEDRLRIGSYLHSYGVTELAPESRLVFESFLVDSIPATKAIGQIAYSENGGKKFSVLYQSLIRSDKAAREGREFRPYSVTLPRPFLKPASRLSGVEIQSDDYVKVETEIAHDFLLGKWLEASIFNKAIEVFEGYNDVEIAAGLRLGMMSNRKSKPDVTEFDLAILAEERLDLVEAKATFGKAGRTKLHGSIDKLAKYRNQLSGQSGKAWLIAPLLSFEDLAAIDAIDHANNEGVRLIWGANAVKKFGNELMASYGIKDR
ncbi:hypothetical protein [uncultured Aliiroseovarius sp.]|uniref:hypothetical protein n=1 Tax=uncultured Aliiroseovarius sp. TaxID=1658783 RepID=UPI002613A1C5|nr:hypothetical protein [uncultured Aliiroseovarius sp.]